MADEKQEQPFFEELHPSAEEPIEAAAVPEPMAEGADQLGLEPIEALDLDRLGELPSAPSGAAAETPFSPAPETAGPAAEAGAGAPFGSLVLPGEEMPPGAAAEPADTAAGEEVPLVGEALDAQVVEPLKIEEGAETREEKEERPKRLDLVEALGQTSPYMVMLGAALLALLIAVLCLYAELNRYDWDLKAKKARQAGTSAAAAPAALGWHAPVKPS